VSEDGGHTLVDVRFYEGLKLFGEDEEVGRMGGGGGCGQGLGAAAEAGRGQALLRRAKAPLGRTRRWPPEGGLLGVAGVGMRQ
jgi:hypothetical protein